MKKTKLFLELIMLHLFDISFLPCCTTKDAFREALNPLKQKIKLNVKYEFQNHYPTLLCITSIIIPNLS